MPGKGAPVANDERPVIVIDNGSGYLKCDRHDTENDYHPQHIVDNVVGYPKFACLGGAGKDYYVGGEAMLKRGVCTLKYPMKHGIVTEGGWDDMEKVWRHALSKDMRITNWGDENEDDEEIRGIIMTEAPLNPTKNRQRMFESMFESFAVRRFYVNIQAVLAMNATGRTTGVVVDIGDGVTHAVPIYEHYWMPQAIQRNNLAGRDLTAHLSTLLLGSEVTLRTSAELETVKKIKEELCYLSMDYATEVNRFNDPTEEGQLPVWYNQKEFTLPDGQPVKVNAEQITCPEILFKPSLDGKEMPGLHDLVNRCVQACDLDVRSELYKSVDLSGGTTCLKNLPERLTYELQRVVPDPSMVKVLDNNHDQRKYNVWTGGAILAGLDSMEALWVTREDYDETGSSGLCARLAPG